MIFVCGVGDENVEVSIWVISREDIYIPRVIIEKNWLCTGFDPVISRELGEDDPTIAVGNSYSHNCW